MIYHFLFRRRPPGLIGRFVDLIFSIAIHDEVDLCVRYLCQLVHLSKETLCSFSGFLSVTVSLGPNFCHEDIERCFGCSFLEPKWQYIPLENGRILGSSEWMPPLFWMPLIVEQCGNSYREAQPPGSRN